MWVLDICGGNDAGKALRKLNFCGSFVGLAEVSNHRKK
jgi:hypothetical protein